MARRVKHILIVTAIITAMIMVILQFYSNNEIPVLDTSVNKNIIQTKSFNVRSESNQLNTSAIGTVFVSGEEEIVEQIRIVALIEIDPNDWGGVAFYIPPNWPPT